MVSHECYLAGRESNMYDENLGNSISFMVDALLTDDREYRDIETGLMDAALRIVQIAWNAEVRGEAVIAPCASVLGVNPVGDAVWERLIRETSQELVNICGSENRSFFLMILDSFGDVFVMYLAPFLLKKKTRMERFM